MSHGRSIRCHSPYKHYTMFHSGGSFSNFNNSIFGGFRCNTTYNINVNDGGFWGGFRNGLGMGFGNLLGGIFGGFMGGMFGGFGNMFGGGFGNMFGGFGGGMGFGFPSFGNGGFWGAGANNGVNGNNSANGTGSNRRNRTTLNDSNSSSANTHSSTDCVDKDQDRITDLDKRLNALDISKDPKEALALYKEISELIKKPLDEDHEVKNKANYTEKLNRLKNNWGFTLDKDGNPIEAKQKTGAGTQTAGGVADQNAADAETLNSNQGGAGAGVGSVDTKDNLENTLSGMNDADKDLDFIKTIPDSVKSQYYKSGYTNYDGSEDITDKDVSNAHDESDVGLKDTVQIEGKGKATITKSSNGNHPATIVIHDRKDITYNYKGTAGSEYIYESDQDKQLYVLQKDTSGEFHLMQYKYMKGNAIKDWS